MKESKISCGTKPRKKIELSFSCEIKANFAMKEERSLNREIREERRRGGEEERRRGGEEERRRGGEEERRRGGEEDKGQLSKSRWCCVRHSTIFAHFLFLSRLSHCSFV